jgi:hypothetical protein
MNPHALYFVYPLPSKAAHSTFEAARRVVCI